MNEALRIFPYRDGETVSHITTVEIDGETWFASSNVAAILGYSNPRAAVIRHCKPRGVTKRDIPLNGVYQSVTFINESNLYRLIVKSKLKLESAERFESWVFDVVLPTIRKTGGYGQKMPVFIKRMLANIHKPDKGYFSVINVLYQYLNGRMESLGYVMADKTEKGKEIRPDVSVGRCFADWLERNYPEQANNYKYYPHTLTEEGVEVDARQYPNELWHLFVLYVEDYWIPIHGERYFKERDPKALPYLQKLLPPKTA